MQQQKLIDYTKAYTVKEENKKEIVIWLEDKERMAIGVIVKKKKGAKRIRQSKKEKKCK